MMLSLMLMTTFVHNLPNCRWAKGGVIIFGFRKALSITPHFLSLHCFLPSTSVYINCRIEGVATPLWPSVGVKPNIPKVGDLESFGTPECLGFNSKAQNTSHWRVLGVIGKVLKRRYRKYLALSIWTFLTQVMGKRRAVSQTASLTPDH